MAIFKTEKHTYHTTYNILGIKFNIKNSDSEQIKLKNKEEYLLCKNMPEAEYPEYLKKWFFEKTGDNLNLDNPQTFNEKIQWLKLYDRNPLKTKLADKYEVRGWVKEKIGEEYLIPLLGVWDSFDDIDFAKLPDKYVLKCNHGCGQHFIVKNKKKFNKKFAKKKFNKWLNKNWAYNAGLELQYENIKPRIIAEEFIESKEGLVDYKLWCFDGKVKYIQYISDRNKYCEYQMAFFDRDWKKQSFISNHVIIEDEVKKPENLDKLIEVAEVLSKDFQFVRVDLYILDNGDIKFGEMTFTPGSGVLNWQPKSKDLEMGQGVNVG